MQRFINKIPVELQTESGRVFYSGKTAFSYPSKLYILGLNPGGNPEKIADTVNEHSQRIFEQSNSDWSAYYHEVWKVGKEAGTHGMQPRVRHLLDELKYKNVPASNLIFKRSSREKDIKEDFNKLAELCWPFHEAVIRKLKIKVILCFGKSCGKWVTHKIQADDLIDNEVEKNNRQWVSKMYRNEAGFIVIVATHPSIADWTNPDTSPIRLVKDALEKV